jgi:hypothetical protein
MSDQATGGSGWLTAAVSLTVAAIAIIGGIFNERFKRHQAKVSIAAVMHAEISALMDTTLSQGTVQNWTNIARRLEAGENILFQNVYAPDPERGPVFNSNVDKLGFLEPADARDVILFYEHLFGIRVILKNLTTGAWDQDPRPAAAKARQVRVGLGFWEDCRKISLRLLPSLSRATKRQFLWRLFAGKTD